MLSKLLGKSMAVILFILGMSCAVLGAILPAEVCIGLAIVILFVWSL